MNKQHCNSKLKGFILLTVSAVACGAYADAYRNPAPTAEGIAKSGANMVFVDDASAISYNPANLAWLDNDTASVVLHVSLAQSENTYSPAPGLGIVSDDPWVALPNLYVAIPVAEKLTAGLGITSPFGQGVSWTAGSLPPPAVGPPIALYEAKLALVNINPTIAMKISDTVSVGAGADIFYSELTINALIPGPIPAEGKGDGYGVGGNIGLTVQVTDSQTAAITYRSRVDVDYEGDFTAAPLPSGDFLTTLKYPNTVELGYGIQATDAIQVEAMLQWSEWSVNDVQTTTAGVLGSIDQENNWENTITVAIGGSWQFAENWVFRTGYSFIETPIPDTSVGPILPDTNRHIIGMGLGYSIAKHTIDLSYAYTFYEDKTSPPGSAAPGTYEIDSNLLGLTYSYSF